MSPEAKDSFVATRGMENCISLYPADRWEEIEEVLGGLNTFQTEARRLLRTFSRWAEDVTLDSQGRIALSKPLLEFANLTNGRAFFIGVGDKIEIWDPEGFEVYEESGQDTPYPDLVEKHLGAV